MPYHFFSLLLYQPFADVRTPDLWRRVKIRHNNMGCCGSEDSYEMTTGEKGVRGKGKSQLIKNPGPPNDDTSVYDKIFK